MQGIVYIGNSKEKSFSWSEDGGSVPTHLPIFAQVCASLARFSVYIISYNTILTLSTIWTFSAFLARMSRSVCRAFSFCSSWSWRCMNNLKNFSTDGNVKVQVEDSISEWLPYTCGVPQGSCLEPIFFTVFFNDFINTISDNVHCFSYADDI